MNKITSVIRGGYSTTLQIKERRKCSVIASSLIPTSVRKEEGIDNRFEMRWLYG